MKKILIVDDDSRVAQSVVVILEDAGYGATVAEDAKSARAAVADSKPDACICDVWLGKDDGLTLAEEMQADGIPLVVMSGGGPGRSLESVTAKADALGAAAMLFKPFEEEELIEAVEKALRS